VVNRKVCGGNRTWLGAQAQGILMSVIRTCRLRAIDPFEFLIDALCRPQPQLILA
jgi:transposase